MHTLWKQLHGHSLINYSITIKMLNSDRVYTSHHHHHHHHHHHDHYLHSLYEENIIPRIKSFQSFLLVANVSNLQILLSFSINFNHVNLGLALGNLQARNVCRLRPRLTWRGFPCVIWVNLLNALRKIQ